MRRIINYPYFRRAAALPGAFLVALQNISDSWLAALSVTAALNADKLCAFNEVLGEEQVSFVAKVKQMWTIKIQEARGCFQASTVARWFAFDLSNYFAFPTHKWAVDSSAVMPFPTSTSLSLSSWTLFHTFSPQRPSDSILVFLA